MGRRKKATVPEDLLSNATLEERLLHQYCYVCGKKVKATEKSIYIGNGLYRHTDCAPGSPNWMESDVSITEKALPYRRLFELGAEREKERKLERQRLKNLMLPMESEE